MGFIIISILIAIFLALNMGASGFAVSFAPFYGCGGIRIRKASLLYVIFLTLGAFLASPKLIATLKKEIIYNVNNYSGLIILLTSSITLFIANILKIPQSTSFVTIGAISGAGLYSGKINYLRIIEIFVATILFSFGAFIISFILMKFLYPPSSSNIRYYEKIVAKENILKKFILFTNCYLAFAVGCSNVANVITPLIFSGIKMSLYFLILFFSLLFGIGSIIIGKGIINTVSKEVTPLGCISSLIVSLIGATFIVLASINGLPTTLVQITTFAILGISSAKDGFVLTFKKNIIKKILFVWIFIPLCTSIISYSLHYILKFIL